ncbi:MAG: hypothetical protein M1812_005993 [Candelaria pacifica]|nr:MAG: hypothetical protein M1812_005993 [Candelaria pacifica]
MPISPQRSRSFARFPQSQYVVTAVPLTVTPASAGTASPSSSNWSPTPTSSQRSAATSSQSSPEGPRGRLQPQGPPPPSLKLPEATMAIKPTQTTSAMSEAVAMTKGPGLIRRISRGAANKLTRRRTSTSNANSRDNSSGPVILRRRSDSKGGAENGREFVDFNNDDNDEEAIEEGNGTIAVEGIGEAMRSFGRDSASGNHRDGGIAPLIPTILKQGTLLTKVTRKRRRNLKFLLDIDSAKVIWDASKPSTKRFYIDDLREIRKGADARNYREEFGVPAEFEHRWFTIIYADQERSKGRPFKAMHLIASNDYVFELWTTTLENISKFRSDIMAGLAGSGEKSIKAHWRREMDKMFGVTPHAEEEEKMDLEGVEKLCRNLHINCSKNLIRAQFANADTDNTGYLMYEHFKNFVTRLKERKDIKEIFKATAKDHKAGLDLEEFFNFLRVTQGIHVDSDRAHWEKAFEKVIQRSKPKGQAQRNSEDSSSPRMQFEAFSAFLSSNSNSAIMTGRPHTLLDKPLNEYFISSSHNTYLLGRQVVGESSPEAYIDSLQRGCRCVEIDCWDGADGQPMVSHGRTLTTKVPFSDCIAVIGKYAFVSSPYPLIISLEVHCNAEQQVIMTDIMKNVLGDRLLLEPLMTNACSLPSPEELKNRILIKVKAPGEEGTEESTQSTEITGRQHRSLSSPFSRPIILDNSVITSSPLVPSPPPSSPPEWSSGFWETGRGSITGGTGTSASSVTDDSDTNPATPVSLQKEKKKARSKIVKPLGDLGVYTRGEKYRDFSLNESRSTNHVFSFAERTFDNLCRDPDMKAQLEKHNVRCLMRVYPSAHRIKSSNFDPNRFWRRGVQMVATNWQTYDLGTQMNNAMFAAGSDRTGYVLKPKELRKAKYGTDLIDDVSAARMKKDKKLVKFSVEMISAQQLPRLRSMGSDDNIHPYIELEVFCADDKARGVASGEGGMDASARHGMSGIGSPHRRRTKIVHSNGYNPTYNDNMKVSLETKFPSLVFVRWTVWNSADGRNYGNTNDPLATYTAKLDSLRQGYRHLPLFDMNGEQFLFSTLFCKIKKEEALSLECHDARSAKVGTLKQFGRSVFNRTLSIERRRSKEEVS